MKKRIVRTATLSLTMLFAAASISFAQTPSSQTSPADVIKPAAPAASKLSASSPAAATTTATSAQPNEAEMMKQMMELAKLNENHKLLATMAGTWSYNVTMWMAPGAPPNKATGIAVRKAMMDGRYFSLDVSGKMMMPGGDGKMKDMQFKGMGIEAYDNVKKKFVGSWIDNMGTGIYLMEGTYDAATKTFTYNAEMEMMPGMKTKVREVLKIVDADHHNFEWYEDRGGQEMKTMEINYTRKK